MKNISTNNQKGSTHVVVFAVLIVIIIGLVGYLFWNNFVAKKDSANQSASTSMVTKSPAAATSTPTPTKSPDLTGYLVLDDWKIKFKLPTNIGVVRYYKESNTMFTNDAADKSVYGFTTKRNEDRGERCSKSTATNGDVVYLATLIRYKNKINWGPASAPQSVNNDQPIGGWYYYVAESQGDCSTYAGKDDANTINQDWEGIQQLLLSASAL